MWSYNDGFFETSFYSEDVSIESNIGPKQLTIDEGLLVHEHTMPSVHAHHYMLYTKKETACGCYAPATNVIIETFHSDALPTAQAIRTYFHNTVTLHTKEELSLSCPACHDHWTPVRYYADLHYTNHCDEASVKIGFSPDILTNTKAIVLQRAGQQTKLYVQKQACNCIEEAGKISIECFRAESEADFLQRHFQVSLLLDTPFHEQSFRCQTCLPAPLTWMPSRMRVGHFEKYTTFGIMYSTFLSQTLSPSVVYALEPHIFMLAQTKQQCDCLEDVGQIETTTDVTLEAFTQFLAHEFDMHVTPLSNEPQMCCTTCEQSNFILP